MASYKIQFKESAEKDIKKIPKSFLKNVVRKISVLESVPFPQGSIKLTGSKDIYRIRTGDYRIVYSVNLKTNTIIIHYIRHRKEVYRVI